MATKDTPVKLYSVGCFACLNRQPWRAHRLDSAKCTADDILKKVSSVVGMPIYCSAETVICASCITKVNYCHEFKENTINSIKYGNSCRESFVKRCHSSPFSQNTSISNEDPRELSQLINTVFSPKKVSTPKRPEQKRARRKLETCDPRTTNVALPPSRNLPDSANTSRIDDSSIRSIGDHSYSTSSAKTPQKEIIIMPSDTVPTSILRRHGLQWNPDFRENSTCQMEVFTSICEEDKIDTFKVATTLKSIPQIYNAVKREILNDINSEITSLASRTIPFQSSMMYSRSPDKLEQTEEFMESLLNEMEEK